ncbi:MAG TPA: transcriptional repressor [Sedimentisphaerales bacterium]|nr:transcriptional repressor [Sedimentisphaerales bacterium]
MSQPLEDKARHMLKEARLYCTEARVAILQVLLEAGGPLRQDQIARWESHKLNKVTVYRTLDSLAEAGLVHRAFMQNRTWHFELADHCSENQCHPHFTCTNCGVTRCMTDVSLPMAKITQKGYILSRQQVRLEGLCPACA